MTTETIVRPNVIEAVPRPDRWHRPLLALAAAMAVLLVVASVLAVVDPREITGTNGWLKPMKFAISVGIYSVTLAWLIGLLRGRLRRVATVGGSIAVVALAIEMVIIVGFAAAGDTSHFNVSTPFHTAMWSVMAFSIVVVWVITLVIGVLLFRAPLGDRARSLAIRAGVLIAVVGMGLAFLMTGPTVDQLNDFRGIAGAHTVGIGDGGPGLPLLGWSTVAGDLRIPHFVGMHALQAIPLALLVVELLSRRVAVLRDERVRFRLLIVVIATFAATLATITGQALIGQSIVHPAGGILIAGIAIAVASVLGVVGVLTAAFRPSAT